MSLRPVAELLLAPRRQRGRLGVGLVALLLALCGAIVAGSGCSCKRHWSYTLEDHRELRLRGLEGQDIEDEVVARLERNEKDLHPYHVETLKMLGTSRSVALLELIREHPKSDREVREAATAALESIAARDGERPDVVEVRNAYFDRLEAKTRDGELDVFERKEAIKELFYFRPDTARRIADILIDWYGDEEAELRLRDVGYRFAAGLQAPEMVEALCAFATDLDWFHERVSDTFGRIRREFPQRHRELLRACLGDERIQVGAAFLLGEVGDPAIVPVIMPWLDGEDSRKQELALQVLRRVESDEVAEMAAAVVRDSGDVELLLPALTALSTNWRDEETFDLVAAHLAEWPTEARLKALEIFDRHDMVGPRDLYFSLMREDREPEVRIRAIMLRTRGGEQDEARDREVLLEVLGNDRDADVVVQAIGALVSVYGERLDGDDEVCEALIDVVERSSSRRWAAPRQAALEILGNWGRFDDARRIHAMHDPDDFDELHGMYAHRDSRGLRRELTGRGRYVIVPHYRAVEMILRRHRDRHAKAVRGYSPGMNDEERAFLLHVIYLLEPALVRETWRSVLQAQRSVQVRDLRFFQPFAQPDAEEHWAKMVELLGTPLRSRDDRVADAAFSVLGGRFLLEHGARRIRGAALEEIIARTEETEFVEVLKPAFRAIVETGTSRRLSWLAELVSRGVLHADDVAELALSLFERDDLDGDTATIFLEQLTDRLSAASFDEQVVPVVLRSLEHSSREVRRAAANVASTHFHLSQRVEVRLVRRMLEDDDSRVRRHGGTALMRLASWIVERPEWEETPRLRESLTPLLRAVASDDSSRVRRYAAEAIGKLAALAERAGEHDSDFVRDLRATARSIVQHRDNRNRDYIMRPVADFLSAFGSHETLRLTLLALLDNRDSQVRAKALDGLALQAAPELLEPLRELLQSERDSHVRQAALRVYRDAALRTESLEPAIWLVTEYARFEPGDEQFATPIVAAWARETRAAQRRATLLERARAHGEPTYSLLLPTLVGVANHDVVPLMREVLESDEPEHRAQAADVLSRVRGNDEADALLAELINDDELSVRLAAMNAAREQGRLAALAALVARQGEDGLGSVEAEALSEAVSAIVRDMRETRSPTQQLSRLNDLMDAAQASEQQVYLLGQIRTVEHPQRAAYLREHLHARNAEVRMAAIRHLASLEGEDALESFAHLRDDDETEVRLALADALGGISATAAFEFLRTMALDDRDADVRLQALQTLAQDVHDASVTFLLAEVMDDTRNENWPVRREAMRVIRDYRTANVQPLLLKGADDGHAEVRVEAARGLVEFVEDPRGEMIDELQVRAATVTLLNDGNADVRLAALGLAAYFMREGDTELRESLGKLADDNDRAVRAQARRLLDEFD